MEKIGYKILLEEDGKYFSILTKKYKVEYSKDFWSYPIEGTVGLFIYKTLNITKIIFNNLVNRKNHKIVKVKYIPTQLPFTLICGRVFFNNKEGNDIQLKTFYSSEDSQKYTISNGDNIVIANRIKIIDFIEEKDYAQQTSPL